MNPTIHSDGNSKRPDSIPTKLPRKPAPLPEAPKKSQSCKGGFRFTSCVDPKTQKRVMEFFHEAQSTIDAGGTVSVSPQILIKIMQVFISLLDDAETLADIVEFHNDVLVEAMVVVEDLTKHPESHVARRRAIRWFKSMQEGDGPEITGVKE